MPLWRLHYHLVWATKGREPVIGEREEDAVRWSVGKTSDRMGLILHAVGVMPDHVHVAVSIPPRHSVATVMRYVKGASAHAVNGRSGHAESSFSWQAEYGALSFSDRGLGEVIEYVQHQKERHVSNELYTWLEGIEEPGAGVSSRPELKVRAESE
jgi:putative transposase